MLCVAQRLITYKCDLVNVGSCLCRQAGFAALGYLTECYSPTLILQTRRRQTTVSFINKHMYQAIADFSPLMHRLFISSFLHLFIRQSLPLLFCIYPPTCPQSVTLTKSSVNKCCFWNPPKFIEVPPPPPFCFVLFFISHFFFFIFPLIIPPSFWHWFP